MVSTEMFKIGDRVLFSIGANKAEGVIMAFHLNDAGDQVAWVGYTKKDNTHTTVNRTLKKLTKVNV